MPGNSSAPVAGFQIWLQFLLERFAPTMDERFGGRKRAAQDFGDFLVTQLLLPAEQDGGALVFRQAGQGFLNFLRQFAVQQLLRRQNVALVLELLAWLVLMLGMRFLERIGGMARTPADFVQTQVARDGEQPGGKFGA